MFASLTHCHDIAVILTVNSSNKILIERLLASFFQHTVKAAYPLVIFVIDPHSKNPRIIPDIFLDRGVMIRILSCKKSELIAAKNKTAQLAEALGAKWLHFINEDCLFTDTTLSGYLKDADSAIVYQGNIAGLNSTWLTNFSLEIMELYRPPSIKGTDAPLLGQPHPLFLDFENVLINIAAFTKVGGFDEAFITAEGQDLGVKLSQIGQLSYSPSSLVICDFLEGADSVKPHHVLDFIKENRKCGYGRKLIVSKYGCELQKLEDKLKQNPDRELNAFPKWFLQLLIGIAFTEGVIKGTSN